MVQLSLFDVLDEAHPREAIYEVGNRVRIKKAKELDNPDVETVAYLEAYSFGGKVGTIKEVKKGKKSVSYEVETSIGTAILSEGELAFIS
ncbi:hypothetical protein V7128_07490 [Neobacillus vireti]|uniref:hypothetical protein n=1 Tax=Neobacillus vireti TaxID=220686 RepID=UPI002FFFEC5A